jgi:trans-aconitate 2-methyltransferase
VEDHQALFPRLVGYLRGGGCLAVQMPLSWEAPSHRLMRETLANGGPNGQPLGTEELRRAMARKPVEDAEVYYNLLAARTPSLDIWATEYLQILEGDNPVLEWVKGTGLRPILNGLNDSERATFLAEYARRLRLAYPPKPDGRTLYPFRRLFLVALV